MVFDNNQLKPVIFLLCGSILIFGGLLALRLGIFSSEKRLLSNFASRSSLKDGMGHETWMNVYQHRQKIGIYHSLFQKSGTAYKIDENYSLRFNLLGLVTDITVETKGILKSDFSLSSFEMVLSSGRFNYSANGVMLNNKLVVKAGTLGSMQTVTLPMQDKLYLSAGLSNALAHARLSKDDELVGYLFDTSTLSRAAFRVTRTDDVNHSIKIPPGDETPDKIKKYKIECNGLSQYAWISDTGEILREEGLMGLSLEKTTRADALSGKIVEKGEDLALSASIHSPVTLEKQMSLKTLHMEVEGIDPLNFSVKGGRQDLLGQRISITKEILPTSLKRDSQVDIKGDDSFKPYLSATPFIQSNHPKIQNVVDKIIEGSVSDIEKTTRMIQWIYDSIEKRPVISLPNALSTLTLKMGDCNEHAVLLAAMTRAAGIPSKIETGIVYMKGRFYYHAWNLIYVGQWITADSVFNQFPADVTHIRFSSGHDGIQLDLLGIIGKIKITDIGYD